MTQLRLVLVALLAAALALFAFANWKAVAVTLWPGLELIVPLPLLILAILALVYVPMSIFMNTQRLLLRRKIAKLEEALGRTETELSQAKVELLRPPAHSGQPAQSPAPLPQAIPQAPPPPGT